tara:strand:+ start:391 stop:1122 length:732 start_codon:yes stop_codon:yes gene_type:complete
MVAPVNALAPKQPGVLNQLYKTLVPTNARVLIDTMRGQTAPITAKDFAPEELDVLREMYSQKQQRNESWRQDIANKMSISQKDYDKNPEVDFVFDGEGPIQKARPVKISYADYLQQINNQLNSFDATKNKTSISYNDYPDQLAAPTFDSFIDAAWKSYTDPAYRMKTILGSFNVMNTPEGAKAIDKYNFDKSDFYKAIYKIDPAEATVGEMYKKANGPVDFLDMLMIKKFPGASRPVDINLGK